MPKIENLNERQTDGKRFFYRRFDPKGEKFGHRKHFRVDAALLVALGLALGGFFIGHYYFKAKINANTVVVKGLSEMDVKADLAIWEMKYVVTGNDVIKAQQEISNQTKVIQTFLKENG